MKLSAFRESLQRFAIVGMLAVSAVTACAADESPDSSADPIVGKWLFAGRVRKFNADGTCVEKGIYGTWRHAKDESHRLYIVDWKKWVETLHLETEANELKGSNQHGHLVTAKRLE